MRSLMQRVLNSLFFIMKWHKWNFLIGCQWCHTQVNAQVGLFPLLWTYSMTDCEFLESSCPSLVVNTPLLEGLQLCFCNRIETCLCVFQSLFVCGGIFLLLPCSLTAELLSFPTRSIWSLLSEICNDFLRYPFRAFFFFGGERRKRCHCMCQNQQ